MKTLKQNDPAWQRGIPLYEADWKLARKELKAEYNTLATAAKKTSDALLASTQLSPKEQVALLAEMAKALSAPTFVRNKMMDDLLAWLKAGALLAYGFALPRTVSDDPVRVPEELFQKRFLNRKQAGLSGHGLEFAAVRVIHPKWPEAIAAEAAKLQPASSGQKSPGRTSARDHITDAVRMLLSQGKIDPKAPHKTNIALVREFVLEQRQPELIDGKGLGDETIRRVLVSELRHTANPR